MSERGGGVRFALKIYKDEESVNSSKKAFYSLLHSLLFHVYLCASDISVHRGYHLKPLLLEIFHVLDSSRPGLWSRLLLPRCESKPCVLSLISDHHFKKTMSSHGNLFISLFFKSVTICVTCSVLTPAVPIEPRRTEKPRRVFSPARSFESCVLYLPYFLSVIGRIPCGKLSCLLFGKSNFLLFFFFFYPSANRSSCLQRAKSKV